MPPSSPAQLCGQTLVPLDQRPLAMACASLLATALGLVPTPARAQFQLFGGITRPEPGVVCDSIAMTCFNSSGASLDLTRKHLGNVAALRLGASLSGRPPSSEFRLSNGVVCSVEDSTCWSDSRRRRVDRELSADLFGSDNADDKEVSTSRGLCSLSQRGRAVYDGSCELKVVGRESGVIRYAVATGDGRRFVFRRRGDTLELEDATGTWPVDFRNHGYSGVFRWNDMTLVATREHNLLPLARTRSGSAGSGDAIDRLFTGGAN